MDDCLIPASAKNCGETDRCGTCGFNPAVCKRKANIRKERVPKAVKTSVEKKAHDVRAVVEGRLEYAEKRLDEEIRNGEAMDVAYWRGYVDGVKSVLETLERMGGDNNADA